jgi:hypothetical protein
MPIDSLHQEKFLVLLDFVNESATLFNVSTFSKNTLFCSTMFPTKGIVHQYALSWNDKKGSLPNKLHLSCHNLFSLLSKQNPYMNKIFASIQITYIHEWLPCTQLLQLTMQLQPASFSSNSLLNQIS